jgi:hypothetical protein
VLLPLPQEREGEVTEHTVSVGEAGAGLDEQHS